MASTIESPHDSARSQSRQIVARTKGTTKGATTRYFDVEDLGQSLKPFVMLSRFTVDAASKFEIPLHPHSGLAAIILIVDGTMRQLTNSGELSTADKGSVRCLLAGRGVWHGGPVSTPGPMSSYVMSIALPRDQELTESREIQIDTEQIGNEGAARVLLGRYGKTESPAALPMQVNCLHIELGVHGVWRYKPPDGHDILWIIVCSGSIEVGEKVFADELVVFDHSQADILVRALEACTLLVGSAPLSPYELIASGSSVHTSFASLKEAENEIIRQGELLRAQGKLTPELYEKTLRNMRFGRK